MATDAFEYDPSLLAYMTPEEREKLEGLLDDGRIWRPLPGPQLQAFESEADIVGYGGAAGGGKTDLVAGLALTEHERTLIIRREKAQTEGIVQRMTELLGDTRGYSSQKSKWMVERRLIEFGGLDNKGDERRWAGRPHDLKAFDEVTEMREDQVRFIMGWNRTSNPDQRSRVMMTFNPPMTVEGQWVIRFFAPWLDRKHPNPAVPGELRWFTTIAKKDRELPDDRPFVVVDEKPVYDFDPEEFTPEQIIRPKSRTFIPARVTDNPFYMATDYVSQIQSQPEPRRSQLLYGDFDAGLKDDAFQVIPTAWVEAAMERWSRPERLPPMESLGVDVAMGGDDRTVIARRHGYWFDEPIVYEGKDCPNGPTIAGYIVAAKRDEAVIHLDLFGVGAQPYGHLMAMDQHVIGVNVGDPAMGVTENGAQPLFNLRSELVWRMREALDPVSNTGICLPPDRQLLAELCAYTWSQPRREIKVASREEVVDKLGYSPDKASAYFLALMHTPKRREFAKKRSQRKKQVRDPYRRDK